MTRTKTLIAVTFVVLVTFVAGALVAQRGPGRGQGRGKGGPGFRGGRQDPAFQTDHEVFHFLLDNGDKIRRQVKNRKDGIETLTESDDPEIAGKIQEHVAAMYDRLDEMRPIHMRDPLFRELFRHADKITMKLDDTEKGVRVIETSQDPHVAKLLQAHAKVVSLFIKNGRSEAHKNHPVPKRDGTIAAVDDAELSTVGCCQQAGSGCKGEKCEATPAAAKLERKGCCQAGGQNADCQSGRCKAGKSSLKPCCKEGIPGSDSTSHCNDSECQSPRKRVTDEQPKDR